MNKREALRTLREVGTLRTAAKPGTVLKQEDLNQPVARAIRRVIERCGSYIKERPWAPTSDFLTPLP